jgi:uncharacterized protein (DUF1501 family)
MSAPAAPSRRRLLQSAGLAGLFGLMPRLARAIEGGKRRFLFVFCPGGWDPAVVFAPVFGSSHVDLPEDAELAEANGASRGSDWKSSWFVDMVYSLPTAFTI